jgi:hypothetical protein
MAKQSKSEVEFSDVPELVHSQQDEERSENVKVTSLQIYILQLMPTEVKIEIEVLE